MKSKAPLSLMEQLVMLLVFALSAALCLQVFVLSDRMSHRAEARDHAVTMVEDAAEVLKASGGDFRQCQALLGGTGDDRGWKICYDDTWNETTEDSAVYQLQATPVQPEYSRMGSAEVRAMTAQEDVLFQITVSWQEVTGE